MNEPKKILVADDDPDILALVKFRLGREGYKLICVTDGIQALDAVHEHKPDLAVLDWMMPGLDGYRVCMQINADPDINTKVIMLTARVQEQDVTRGFAAGAIDYLRKPFSLQELVARVGRALT